MPMQWFAEVFPAVLLKPVLLSHAHTNISHSSLLFCWSQFSCHMHTQKHQSFFPDVLLNKVLLSHAHTKTQKHQSPPHKYRCNPSHAMWVFIAVLLIPVIPPSTRTWMCKHQSSPHKHTHTIQTQSTPCNSLWRASLLFWRPQFSCKAHTHTHIHKHQSSPHKYRRNPFHAMLFVEVSCHVSVNISHLLNTGAPTSSSLRTGSITCVHDHSYACIYTQGLGTLTSSQHNILDSENLSQVFSCAPDGVQT